MDLEHDILLLANHVIRNQPVLLELLNETFCHIIRAFTLVIGPVVFSALIEGSARAGKGFAQTVVEGEMMDKIVVGMIKGALSPHVSTYTMEGG